MIVVFVYNVAIVAIWHKENEIFAYGNSRDIYFAKYYGRGGGEMAGGGKKKELKG